MKTYIIANWKMNPGSSREAVQLAEDVAAGIQDTNSEVVLCPPFVFIPQLPAFGKIQIGGQDCFWEDSTGAYTGEISASMLMDMGCSYVILGHSERKNHMGETLNMINKKVRAALRAGLTPVVCIGEKQHGVNKDELASQMKQVLKDVSAEDAIKTVLTYEPEWAISSNKDATPAQPEDCNSSIQSMRETIAELFGDHVAKGIPILYGGSTNSKNINKFIREGGAQGALVGSSSLDAEEFIAIVEHSV